MSDGKDQRYIKIAQACLRAINSAAESKAGRDAQIRAVYDAIDRAFREELKVYQNDINELSAALEQIAAGDLDEAEAQKVAAAAVSGPNRTQGGRQH
ncbi:hypothetical protein [Hydrocarboniclastica marina]|uniref:Uncharacterized protein n=1 Tax=Hydrocarboniclastica marina TaxID=2259620 RepID=A0A4P7XEY0_9ALTE|nr:hypothetical protein [Hydrocarboniclastica marina]MAL97097.1 hypothetical protein [Alteromonadaceae bacterium]QCF25509.1 hypothetical protein soil367_05965 [Hydrocarboniclastica marina]|tara:strand:- start:1021 stop:1311 length:291 start_codon:yes stop_codon:yes gene_type:complete